MVLRHGDGDPRHCCVGVCCQTAGHPPALIIGMIAGPGSDGICHWNELHAQALMSFFFM